MELDNNLPQAVIDIFEEESPVSVTVRTDQFGEQSCLQLHGDDGVPFEPIEFTRITGMKCIEETGYAVTGMRQENDGEYIEVWFDPVAKGDYEVELTVAQRAARCLDHKENDTRFEPNLSNAPKKQYVDVFPDPHEDAQEDYRLRAEDIERLDGEGLEIRRMSCGRARSEFNGENYRIWFTSIED